MKNPGFLSLFLLILVVFLSGCTDGGNPPLSTGVIIKGFAPDFTEVYPGEPVTLYIEMQNVGDADAKNTVATLMVLNPAEWDSPTSNHFENITIGTLRGASFSNKSSGGDEWGDEWDLTAPTIATPEHTFTAGARVYYDYKTNASATFNFLTDDYIKSKPVKEQEALKTASALNSSTSSRAPIQVSFSTGARPFIVYTDGQTFSFQIIITNVGQGNPIYNGRMYYMKINEPDIAGDIEIDCPGIDQNFEIRLMRGASKRLSCSITVDRKADIVGGIMQGNVWVDLGYTYFVDAFTAITVIQQA